MIRISDEVAAALEQSRAVVALESSVIAQGLPRPRNLEAARACEAAIRDEGAIPATIAVLDGEIRCGLEDAELRRLAESAGLWKIGGRDLAVAVALGASGGTTVSATCEVASRAGIRLFATGGIGGVHRGVTETWDVSEDLRALSRCPVGVVCAGAKSILDLPRTLEALESLGVPVLGVGTDAFPAFYARTSGLPLDRRVDSPEQAAAVLEARFEGLGQGGVVLALPPPESSAMEGELLEREVANALKRAAEAQVRGKAVTPFLLAELSRSTDGRSLRVNIELLIQNARFAAQIARSFSLSVAKRSRRLRQPE